MFIRAYDFVFLIATRLFEWKEEILSVVVSSIPFDDVDDADADDDNGDDDDGDDVFGDEDYTKANVAKSKMNGQRWARIPNFRNESEKRLNDGPRLIAIVGSNAEQQVDKLWKKKKIECERIWLDDAGWA